jgi:hypothetical protein
MFRIAFEYYIKGVKCNLKFSFCGEFALGIDFFVFQSYTTFIKDIDNKSLLVYNKVKTIGDLL